jgi:hypothetical protein
MLSYPSGYQSSDLPSTTAALLLPLPLGIIACCYVFPAKGRVTDGARTRDLRSHNPMLYQLSYGHQARTRFYQEK